MKKKGKKGKYKAQSGLHSNFVDTKVRPFFSEPRRGSLVKISVMCSQCKEGANELPILGHLTPGTGETKLRCHTEDWHVFF